MVAPPRVADCIILMMYTASITDIVLFVYNGVFAIYIIPGAATQDDYAQARSPLGAALKELQCKLICGSFLF